MRIPVTIAVVALVCAWVCGSAFAQTPTGTALARAELDFVEPDSLTFALPSDDYKTVWLRSSAGAIEDLHWQLLVDKGGARPITVRESDEPGAARRPALEIQGGDDGIAEGAVAGYRIRVRGLTTDKVKGAQLVASATATTPATLDVSISAKSDFSNTVTGVLLWPLGIALLFMLIRGLTVRGKFGGEIGSLDLDFSKSFATTLTALGALLGTLLADDVVGEATSSISKQGFQTLNLTFGVVIVLAPITYLIAQRTITKTEDGKPKTHYVGKTWALLLASAVTLWAVLGEIYTTFLLLDELAGSGDIEAAAVTIMQVGIGIGAVLACAYSWRKLRWIVETAAGGDAPALAGGFMPTDSAAREPQLPTWTPL
jgi:hypothetical protein